MVAKSSAQDIADKFEACICSNDFKGLAKLKKYKACPLKLAYLQAVKSKAYGVLDILSEFDLDINATDAYGRTALGYALRFRDATWIEKLICLGADPNQESLLTYPIVDAVRTENPDVVAMLLNAGSKVDRVEESGLTTMEVAINGGNIEIIRMLLDHGGKVDQKALNGQPLIEYTKGIGRKDAADLLQQYKNQNSKSKKRLARKC